ncbi:MAG: hypothetical protein V8Q84_12835 [Bilophila sp.]
MNYWISCARSASFLWRWASLCLAYGWYIWDFGGTTPIPTWRGHVVLTL